MLPTHSGFPIPVPASRFGFPGMQNPRIDEIALAWSIPALALVAAALVTADTWHAMFATWAASGTLGHGIAVLPIVAWLVWRGRHRLAGLRPAPDPLGVLAVGAAAAAWGGADLTGADVAAQYAAVAVLPAIVWATAGPVVVRELAFPLVFLFFMVPSGEWLNSLLTEATAGVTALALGASGVTVLRDGVHLTLPTGRWSVVEAYGGLHFLLAAAMLSTLFAHLNRLRTAAGLALFTTALGVALVANWLSVYTMLMLGHTGDIHRSFGDGPMAYGWVSCGVLLVGVAVMGLRWRESRAPQDECERHGLLQSTGRPEQAFGPLKAALLCLALAVGARAAAAHLGDVRWDTGFEARAAAALGDHQPGAPVIAPRFDGGRGVLKGTLARTPDADFFIAYFARQGNDQAMLARANVVVSDSDPEWRTVTRSDATVRIGDPALPVTEWRLRSSSGERLLWSWYTVDGRPTHRADVAWLRAASSVLSGRGDQSTVTVVGTAIDGTRPGDPIQTGGIERARARLETIALPLATLSSQVTGR
jgi:EpsI family protein